MARINEGIIREAINKLGGSLDDAVRKTVDDFAETATKFAGDMGTNPRKAFHKMVDDFGDIKYGDNFVARSSNLYGSNAPVYSGEQNFVIKKLRPEDVEVIPPSWNRGGADFQAPAIRQKGELYSPGTDFTLVDTPGTDFQLVEPFQPPAARPNAELSYNPGTKFTMEGGSGPEYTGQNFTMGAGSDTVYTGPMKGSTELATVNSNTGLAQRRLDNTADMARDAYIEQDVTKRMNKMDADAQAKAKRAEFLGRNGRRQDGSRMSFFERRNAKKYYQNQDWLSNADKYANGEVDINGLATRNSRTGAGDGSGIAGFVHDNQLVVAAGIAGTALVGASLLDE